MRNIMSIDLEDWFQVHNLSGAIPYEEWDRCELRVVANTARILTLLQKHRVKATFFALGWVAERLPGLVRDIAGEGHEIASHTYAHKLLTHQTPEEFEKDLEKSLAILREVSGQPVNGFRAPSFSVTRMTLWAYEIMRRQGIAYDSSVFPIGFHPDYGISDAPLTFYRTTGSIVELPLSCARVLGRSIPCSGGGYFRLFPYEVNRSLMRRCNAEGRPVVFYIHPWEFDPDQPRVRLSKLKAFRHYTNLHKTEERFDRLLRDFAFGSIRDTLQLEGLKSAAVGLDRWQA
jgi:polysaccharide deacetylase family protein (PEP-CTERM system associated)